MCCILQEVRSGTAHVAETLDHVRIDRDAIAALAARLGSAAGEPPPWDLELQFSDGTPRTAEWVFLVDSLNFCFWPDRGAQRWTVEWGGVHRRGYFALSCALRRAVERGDLDLSPRGYADMSVERLGRILAGRGKPPLLPERVSILRENAAILMRDFGGSFPQLVESCGRSASLLVRKLYDHFPSFRDECAFRGRKVLFMKRAQILASDLFGAFGGQGLGNFTDLEQLTAFADYRIPQILRSLGVLAYSDDLAAVVDREELIPAGSEYEIALRAATITAVEALVGELGRIGIDGASAFGLDWRLWNESHRPEHNLKPYHLTRTVFY